MWGGAEERRSVLARSREDYMTCGGGEQRREEEYWRAAEKRWTDESIGVKVCTLAEA